MKKEVLHLFPSKRIYSLGESFGDDVKGLTKIMNGYMDAITQPDSDSDGMVNSYIGDASMHVPMHQPMMQNIPTQQFQCGLNMLKAVEKS